MSFYVVIGSLIVEIVAVIATGIAVGIVMIKSRQATDPSDKAVLRAAGILAGLSILFIFLMMVSAFVAFSTKGCTRRRRWFLLITAILSGVSLATSLIIIFVIADKYQKAGKTADAQNLRGSAGTIITALVLHLIAFILLWLVIGRRLAAIGRACRQAAPVVQSVKTEVQAIQAPLSA